MLVAIAAREGELLAAVFIAVGICAALAATGMWWLKRRLRGNRPPELIARTRPRLSR